MIKVLHGQKSEVHLPVTGGHQEGSLACSNVLRSFPEPWSPSDLSRVILRVLNEIMCTVCACSCSVTFLLRLCKNSAQAFFPGLATPEVTPLEAVLFHCLQQSSARMVLHVVFLGGQGVSELYF